MAYTYCNQCGHRNPPDSTFCSSCGSPLDLLDDRTITLTAIDKVQMEVNDVQKTVFVIRPTVKNLTNPEANKKLREAKIYVTDDKDREILKIASDVFIGTVTTKLISYTPDRSTVTEAPGTTTVAQRDDVDEDGEPKAQPRL